MVQWDRDCILYNLTGPLFSTYLRVKWGVKSITLHYKQSITTSKDNMVSLVARSQMLDLSTEISIEKRF